MTGKASSKAAARKASAKARAARESAKAGSSSGSSKATPGKPPAKAALSNGSAETAAEGRSSRALGVHYDSLDGLRAVGMAAIFLGHSEFRVFQGAYMGLSMFFTMSGFLITSILLRRRDKAGPMRLDSFWSQRYRRLMPAALLCLFGIVIFGATVADPAQAKEIPGEVAAAAAQVVNWFFIYTDKSYIHLFAAPSPVQHFWSLAIEEQFYVVMPIVFWVIVRYTRTLKPIAAFFGIGTVASTLWMIWLYNHGATLDRLYYGTDTRAAEILVGGLLAVVLYQYPLTRLGDGAKRILAAVGVVAFGVSLYAWATMNLTDTWVYRGGFLAFALVSCALIVSLVSGGPVTWLLSLAFLPALGRITYGLYLFHWPIMLWLTSDRTGLDGVVLFTVQVAVTFAVAIASYHLLEMPIRKGIPNWPKGAIKWAVAPTVAVAIVALAFVAGSHEATATQDGVFELAGDRNLPDATVKALLTPMSGPPAAQDGVLKVMVVGDSMARSLGFGLEQWATEAGSAVVWNAATSGCGVLDEGKVGREIGSRGMGNASPENNCGPVHDGWARSVEEFDPDLVIMLSTGWDLRDRQLPEWSEPLVPGDEAFDAYMLDEYRDAVDVLSAQGATVLWLQGPCSYNSLIPDDKMAQDAFDPKRVRHLDEDVIPQLMSDRSQVRTFDLNGILCPDGEYVDTPAGFGVLRPDGIHFTQETSLSFAQRYAAEMIAAGRT